MTLCAPAGGAADEFHIPVCLPDDEFAAREFEVTLDHLAHKLVEAGLRLPAKYLARLRGVADQHVNLSRAEVARVYLDVLLPVEVEQPESLLQKLSDGVSLARG